MRSTLRWIFCYFSPCPYCRKCLISKTENVSPTGKQLLLNEQMTSLQITAQGEFLLWIIRGWQVPWWRTESWWWSQVFRLFWDSVCYMAHKKCCEINTVVVFLLWIFAYRYSDCSFWQYHLFFFLVNVCIHIPQTLFFLMMSFVPLCVRFCNEFKGGLSLVWNTMVQRFVINI